jgi:hypothetical protein
MGTVDEIVLDYLLGQGQSVMPVAYHRYDFSEQIRGLVAGGEVHYIDASVESLPKGISGPSARDILFCVRSDLIVLFWDGHSRGTRELIDYFQNNGKSLLVSFI